MGTPSIIPAKTQLTDNFMKKNHAASLPGLEIPVAVAVLGWSLFHDKYVWSPSLLSGRYRQSGQPRYEKVSGIRTGV